MKYLSLNDISEINYKYIFDYYDRPLSFIGNIKNQVYFFYFLSDERFLTAELSESDVMYLSDNKDITDFVNRLLYLDKLGLIDIDFSTENLVYRSINFRELRMLDFPEISNEIKYDYLTESEIQKDFRFESHLEFQYDMGKSEQIKERRYTNINVISDLKDISKKVSLVSRQFAPQTKFNALEKAAQTVLKAGVKITATPSKATNKKAETPHVTHQKY